MLVPDSTRRRYHVSGNDRCQIESNSTVGAGARRWAGSGRWAGGVSATVGSVGNAIGRFDHSHVSFASDEQERGIRIRHKLLRFGVIVHQQVADRPAFGKGAGRDQSVEVSQVVARSSPGLSSPAPATRKFRGSVGRTIGDAYQIDSALGRPLRQLLRIAGGIVSGNTGRPVGSRAGIEVVGVPDVLAFLRRRRENRPDQFAAESGRLPQRQRRRGAAVRRQPSD